MYALFPIAFASASPTLPQRDDIVRLLYELATDAGAQIDFNTEVISIHQGSAGVPNPSVTLANGDVLTADIIVGADGYKSMVREVVLEEEDCAEPAGMTLYTGVVDAKGMLSDPELRPYALADEVRASIFLRTASYSLRPCWGSQWPIWMGSHRSICGEPQITISKVPLHISDRLWACFQDTPWYARACASARASFSTSDLPPASPRFLG